MLDVKIGLFANLAWYLDDMISAEFDFFFSFVSLGEYHGSYQRSILNGGRGEMERIDEKED